MMDLEKMRNNGSFKLDGREYVLLQQAYYDYNSNYERAFFAAYAICVQDEPVDGSISAYRVEWDVIGDDEDDSFNADWDEPCSVKETGKFSIEECRII